MGSDVLVFNGEVYNHLALRDAIAAVHGLNPANILCGNGSDELLGLLCQTYLSPGDEGIVTEHGFLVYKIQITGAGHGLEGNESGDLEGGTGDNVGCEYEVSSGNYDEGGNEANGASVGSGGAFPTGCLGSD